MTSVGWRTVAAAMLAASGCSSNSSGDQAPKRCGDLAGVADGGDPKAFYFDSSTRLKPATTPAHPPPLTGSIELRGEAMVQGSVEQTDPMFVRVGTLDCLRPPDDTYHYNVDVYAVTLVGPGPHNLIADTCADLTTDTVLQVYQDASASSTPFDLDDSCPHLVAFDDDGCNGAFGQSVIRATGLLQGVVQIAVTSAGTIDPMPRPYTLKLASDTSCP